MAFVFFSISSIVFFISVIKSNIRNKYWLTLPNILFVTVTCNFILYLCGWSTEFKEPVYDETYNVIGVLQLLFSFVSFFYKKPEKMKRVYVNKVKMGRNSVSIANILLIMCILLCIVENLYLHGGLFATSIKFHTASMPIFGTILKALYPIAYIISFIEFSNTKSKSVLVLFIISLLYSVLGSKGRFWAICSLLCVIFFFCYYEYIPQRDNTKKNNWFSRLKTRYKVILIIIAVYSFNYLMSMGINRIGTFTYADMIGYNGPWKKTALGETFAWYYGYFPFSYYNLNISIRHIYDENIISYGGFLLYPFLSLINIEGLVGIDYARMTANARVVQNTAATVATGYYESISDFHNLFFFTVIILLAITHITKKTIRLNNYISFSYMMVVWSFMSFLNIFTVGIPLYVFIISSVINRLFITDIPPSELKIE